MKTGLALLFTLIFSGYIYANDTINTAFDAYEAKNYQEAFKLFKKVEQKDHNSVVQFALGVMYTNGQGVRQDDKEAVKWYRKSAEQGDADAQYNLGVRYDSGQGVRQDYKEAVKWYRKSAEQGDADAQSNLGVRYAKGQGMRQDKRMAKDWFGKSCDNGLQTGCDSYRVLNEAGY